VQGIVADSHRSCGRGRPGSEQEQTTRGMAKGEQSAEPRLQNYAIAFALTDRRTRVAVVRLGDGIGERSASTAHMEPSGASAGKIDSPVMLISGCFLRSDSQGGMAERPGRRRGGPLKRWKPVTGKPAHHRPN
jgi:hypothetical protein